MKNKNKPLDDGKDWAYLYAAHGFVSVITLLVVIGFGGNVGANFCKGFTISNLLIAMLANFGFFGKLKD